MQVTGYIWAMKKIDSHREAICPVARTLARVGDAWSLMILRDAHLGRTRFEQFRESLGVAPNILTDRLGRLTAEGFLERRPYSERPPRDDYVLTPRGQEFGAVLEAMKTFGERHLPQGCE
jgi:DNA-binding HxlR family transcriptional regulator